MLYCLRNKKTGEILNVGYSPEGLAFTTNRVGRSVLFRNGLLTMKNGKLSIKPVGSNRLIRNNNIVVLPYEYKRQDRGRARNMEDVFRRKAQILLY